MNKKIVYSLIFIILLIVSAIIDESLTADKYRTTLGKIQASGILQRDIKTSETLFKFQTSYTLTLDKMPLITRLILKIKKKNSLQSLLSTLEGITFKIDITRNKYLFDHTLVAKITVLELPIDYRFESMLLEELLTFAQKTPDLFLATFNLNNSEFSLSIPTLNKVLNADNNISYSLSINNAKIEGLFETTNRHALRLSLNKFQGRLSEDELLLAEITSKNLLFDFTQEKDANTFELSNDTFMLNFYSPTATKIAFSKLLASQEKKFDTVLDFFSTLSLSTFEFQSNDRNISFDLFDYDLTLQGVEKEPLTNLNKLLFSINSSNILYIYDEISKEVTDLLKSTIILTVKKLEMNRLKINDKLFDNNAMTLSIKADKERPLRLHSTFNISNELYLAFLNNVPNASITQRFISDTNSSRILFDIVVDDDILTLNNKRLHFDESKIEPVEDLNTTSDENETNTSVADEESD